MKTLQEIKDEVAREENYSDWEAVGAMGVSDWMVDEIATRSIDEFEAVINRMADLIKKISESEEISDAQRHEMYLILNEFNKED